MGVLTKIKQRPDSEKKIFSLIMALIFTFVIVFVWFSFKGNSYFNKNQNESESQSKLSSLSPVQIIKDEFSKVFADTKNRTSQSINDTWTEDGLIKDLSTSTSDISTTTIATTTSTTTVSEVKASTSTTSNKNKIN